MYVGEKMPRPWSGRIAWRLRINSIGISTQGREPGPYTSPGRTMVQLMRPAA